MAFVQGLQGVQGQQQSHQTAQLASIDSAEIAGLLAASNTFRNAAAGLLEVDASLQLLAAISHCSFANGNHGNSNILLVDNAIKLIDCQQICGWNIGSAFICGSAHLYSNQQNLGCLLVYRCHGNGSIGMQLC